MSENIYDAAAKYGVKFTGELVGHEYHDQVSYDHQMSLSEVAEAKGKITRVRVLADRWPSGYKADISYIHATLPDGKTVPVIVGGDVFSGDLWGKQGLKARMIEWAKQEKVFAKDLGLLDEANWSVQYG